jgi:hypothetical protein
MVGRGPPPLPAAPANTPPSATVPVGSAAQDSRGSIEQAISTALAPLLKKQHELEARLERESAERQRLRQDLELLRATAQTLATPGGVVALPEMLDGARRGRRVMLVLALIVVAVLGIAFGAMLLSQTRPR